MISIQPDTDTITITRRVTLSVVVLRSLFLEHLVLATIPSTNPTCRKLISVCDMIQNNSRKSVWGRDRLEEIVKDDVSSLSGDELLSRLETIMMNSEARWPDQQIIKQSIVDEPGPFAKHGERLRLLKKSSDLK